MLITMGNTMRINCGNTREAEVVSSRTGEHFTKTYTCTADNPCSQCTEYIYQCAESDMRKMTSNDYFDNAIAIIVDGYEASNPVWR